MDDVKLTNWELRRIGAALRILSNRRMANLGADLKVARMLRIIGPALDPLEAAFQQLEVDVIDGRDPSKFSYADGLAVNKALREGRDALGAGEAIVALPVGYALRESDLPKEQSGAEGWKNAEGLGALVADLGPLFVDAQNGA